MLLIIDNTEKVFDIAKIGKGDLIRAKYHSWPAPRNGIVTAVSENKLTVLFLPDIGNVTNYFVILASEVEAQKWAVKWTSDFVSINAEGELP